jgi:hypothetical protein
MNAHTESKYSPFNSPTYMPISFRNTLTYGPRNSARMGRTPHQRLFKTPPYLQVIFIAREKEVTYRNKLFGYRKHLPQMDIV